MKSRIFIEDARKIGEKIVEPSIDVTITSPPYFDLKDYCHDNQIGFGQTYDEYMSDLKSVFKDVLTATKDTGSLWVIIDSFKRNGAVVPLPFDFAHQLSLIGWKLQDIIIWKKDRTVPWAHSGSTRKIFEYILLFTKSKTFKYYSERARETTELKEWWIRYPERYSPNGKSLEEVWEFSIPTQGSWGEGYIRHFCPLPEALVKRIITLTTDEGDVVFDPFSGSGTVPAQASFMRRSYLGFELNPEYVSMFEAYHAKHLASKQADYDRSKLSIDAESFRQLIIKLRLLKYGRILLKKLTSLGLNINAISIEETTVSHSRCHDITAGKFRILVDSQSSYHNVISASESITSVAPLSKFGVHASIEPHTTRDSFLAELPTGTLYIYSRTCTHKFKGTFERENFDGSQSIFSSIGIDINYDFYRSYE